MIIERRAKRFVYAVFGVEFVCFLMLSTLTHAAEFVVTASGDERENGRAALAVLETAAAGDCVKLVAGSYHFAETQVELWRESRGVDLKGAGKRETILKSNVQIWDGAVVHPGNGSEVSDLTIHAVLPDKFQAPWGATMTDQPFVGASLHDVVLRGESDGVFVNNERACSGVVVRIETNTRYDAVATLNGTYRKGGRIVPPTVRGQAVHQLRFYDSHFIVTGPTLIGTGRTCSVNWQAGKGQFTNCLFAAVNGGDVENTGILITAGELDIRAGSVTSRNNGRATALDIDNQGGTIRVGQGFVFDPSRVRGKVLAQ